MKEFIKKEINLTDIAETRKVFLDEENINSEFNDFLLKNKLTAKSFSFDRKVDVLKKALQQGLLRWQLRPSLEADQNSLICLPAFVNYSSDILVNEPVLVFDAGGTNLRIARLFYQDSEAKGEKIPVIEHFISLPMPGIVNPVSKDEFLDYLIDKATPFLKDVKYVGFCFSYPAEIMPNGDGKILAFGKEVNIQGMEGSYLLASLNERLIYRGFAPFTYGCVVNDTIATLLSGGSFAAKRQASLGIGYILGTGMNMAYFDKLDNIGKLTHAEKEIYASGQLTNMAINTEIGCFMPDFRGSLDEKLDELSTISQDHALEKMMSGRYMGSLFTLALKELVSQKLIEVPYDLRKKLEEMTSEKQFFNTVDLSNFLKNPFSKDNVLSCFSSLTKTSRSSLYRLAYEIVNRTSFLLATIITAVALHLRTDNEDIGSLLKPLLLILDGSTYYKTPFLEDRTKYYLQLYLEDKYNFYTQIIQVENGNLQGASLAALSQLKKLNEK